MNIFFVSSEVAPFIKTGGLADVAGSLPPALARRGHEVRVILPLYEGIDAKWREQMSFIKYFYVRVAWRSVYCGLYMLERDGVIYYFVDNEYYFKRSGVYGHYDDAERYAFFCRAVMEVPSQLDYTPDIIHCNDWQTALIPIYMIEDKKTVRQLADTKTVYTIHNIEYQGRYGADTVSNLFGLHPGYLNEGMLLYYGDVNLMKGAIQSADYVTTVSPTYAEELQYAFYAHGLEGVVAANYSKIDGILNGIDTQVYNSELDQGIAANFSVDDLSGKAICKAELQNRLHLNSAPDVPIVAIVSRLAGHKGFELLTSQFNRLMNLDIQFVLLGTGEWNYEQFFREAANRYPGRVSANLMYNAKLSNAIYAGSDLYVMPSIAEPCGLSQMIAMRYGTIPIVRETGGLKDSVGNYDPVNNPDGRGFTFPDINGDQLVDAVERAVNLYQDKPAWQALMKKDMQIDFSWNVSAGAYEQIYSRLKA